MKNKSLLMMIFLSLLTVEILSQDQSNYYIKDGVRFPKAKMYDWGEKYYSEACIVFGETIDVKERKYSPYEVEEYGFKDGRVFVAKDITLNESVRRVFLERVLEGEKITLYCFYEKGVSKIFYLERSGEEPCFSDRCAVYKGSETNEQVLKDLMNECVGFDGVTRFVKPNKRALKKTIAKYDKCDISPFPYLKYGIVAGYEFMKLNIGESLGEYSLKTADSKYEGSFTIGAFVDLPLFYSDFSLHVEGYYAKHSYSLYDKSAKLDVDYLVNISSLKLPVLVRYTYPSKRVRPFVNAGVSYSYHFDLKDNLYTATKDISSHSGGTGEYQEVKIEKIKSSLISKNELGVVAGLGVECKINHKNAIFIEFRYSDSFGMSKDYSIDNSAVQILTSFNF